MTDQPNKDGKTPFDLLQERVTDRDGDIAGAVTPVREGPAGGTMLKLRTLLVVLVMAGLGVAAFVSAQAPRADAGGATLTPQDYIDIQHLVASYAHAIDTCSNNGYDYADLYAPGGAFVGWGGTRWEGRDRLAEAAGGGTRGCRKLDNPQPHSHVTANLVIQPSEGGATGKSYLIYPGVQGQHGDPNHSGHVGGYEDVYVKTSDGWRFQLRTRIQPAVPSGRAPD